MGNTSNQKDMEKLSEPFKALIGNQGLNYQILDLLPIPIEIFAPNGTAIFINRALLELLNIPDADLVVGKYNLKNDPVCLEILGQVVIDKTFRGETVSIQNFPAPVQDLVDRGVINEKPFESAIMDLFCLPIWDGEVFTCTICFFTIKNMYQGRADIAKAQEYIKQHWQEKFDLDKAAQAANLSHRYFQRMFKEVTGDTPRDYYQNYKIHEIQEKLLDTSLSIEQTFIDCGVDVHGKYFRMFKEITKQTPLEYRKANIRK